jgi:hypothetical protein
MRYKHNILVAGHTRTLRNILRCRRQIAPHNVLRRRRGPVLRYIAPAGRTLLHAICPSNVRPVPGQCSRRMAIHRFGRGVLSFVLHLRGRRRRRGMNRHGNWRRRQLALLLRGKRRRTEQRRDLLVSPLFFLRRHRRRWRRSRSGLRYGR